MRDPGCEIAMPLRKGFSFDEFEIVVEPHLKMVKSFDGNAFKNLAIELNPKASRAEL